MSATRTATFRNSNCVPIGPTHYFFIQPPSTSIFELVQRSDVFPLGTYKQTGQRGRAAGTGFKKIHSLDTPSLQEAFHQVTDSVSCTYLWPLHSCCPTAALRRRHESEHSKILGQTQSRSPRLCFVSTKHRGRTESRRLERDYGESEI